MSNRNASIEVSRRMLEPVLEDWIGWYNDYVGVLPLEYRTRYHFAHSLLDEIKRLNREENDEKVYEKRQDG